MDKFIINEFIEPVKFLPVRFRTVKKQVNKIGLTHKSRNNEPRSRSVPKA